LLAQVDDRRNPRIRDQLVDRWFDVRPMLGRLPLTKVDAETLNPSTPACARHGPTPRPQMIEV
jgi:hypothetical protein